jgi:hypothetical protein
MIALEAVRLETATRFPDTESAPEGFKIEGAIIEGRWYGEGSLGVPFTEELNEEESGELTNLLARVSARVAEKKRREDAAAVLV